MTEFFPNIPKIKYEGPQSDNPLAFKFYNPDEVIAGKKMKDQLRFSMAWWHTLCANGTDMFGVGTVDKSFCTNDPMDLAKAKVEAGFEIMDKTGIEFFAFHDRDIAPEGENLAETNKNLDVIVDLIEAKMKETGKKLLWDGTHITNDAASDARLEATYRKGWELEA